MSNEVKQIAGLALKDEKARKSLKGINVIAEGILNDGRDTTESLQTLINKYPEGTTFYFENGTYNFKNIELPSNTKIIGNTNTKFVIPSNTEIACNFLLENVENIIFENVYMQNGENPNTGVLYGGNNENFKCCILAKECNNIQIKNSVFNKFYYGIHCIDTNNVHIENCKFKNSGYSMIMALNDSKFYNIVNCEFDTCYSNVSNKNTYMVSFSCFNYETQIASPENIIIENCKFKNNEYWEGIDTHGANNIKILNCYFYNIKNAIVLFNDQRYTMRHLKMRDIIIENCNILSDLVDSRGILVSGAQNGLVDGFLIQNVVVKNNTIKIPNIETDTIYALYLHYIENLIVDSNLIEAYQNCLRTHMVLYGTISNNKITSNLHQPVIMYYTHLVDFIYNKIFMKETNNNAMNTFDYSNICCLNNVANNSADFNKKYGSASIYATFGKPLIDWTTMRETNEIVTSKNVSRNATSAKTATTLLSGTAGSEIITTSQNIFKECSILQNISIVNGGGSGVNLDCYIKEYIDENHIKISTPLLSNISDTTFTLTPRTLNA